MCGGSPSPPTPDQPAPPPTEREGSIEGVRDRSRLRRRAMASGRSSTMLTGTLGAGAPTGVRRSLGA
ncbi:MAG: hypothetical protein GY942_18620 [Aestuariibacter sp.]|nr:hypothetical protein [Aestuariibacter sp.]